ncbi:MAG: hypothetical protein IT377_04390 [Polyangiaceae bacterium]|nr:hypothetical protein [Polyangiaceae bacterium]
MAVRNIIKALAALAASAGAGGAYFATHLAAPTQAAPEKPSAVWVETQEAPAGAAQSVKVEANGKKVDVKHDSGSSSVQVESGKKQVEVKQSKKGSAVKVDDGKEAVHVEQSDDGEKVQAGNVQVNKKAGGLSVKVGGLVVDTSQ